MDEIRADLQRMLAWAKLVYPSVQKRIKAIFTSILLIPVWIVLLLGGLSYSGFCFEEYRFLSDEEIIHIAITDVLKTNREEAERLHDPSILYPWHTVDEYLVANPGCCIVIQFSEETLLWLGKLFGYNAGYVLFEIPDKSATYGKRKSLLKITNCGQVINPWSGIF